MNYDIRISGNKADNGLLEFDRLRDITQTTKEIATKALMLRVRGFSEIKPDSILRQALSIRLQSLSGNEVEGTFMLLDCDNFEKYIKHVQLNLYRPTEEILVLTPMALVIQSFRSALSREADKDNLDKPLLKTLLKFKRNFLSDEEVFYFSNRNSIPEIRITKGDFKEIEYLEDSIPEPRKIIINGQLDEMKVSKNRLGLITQDGPVSVFANDKDIIHGIVDFLGKEVTISGIAHFKPSGQLSYVEVQEYAQPGTRDAFFSKKPIAFTVEQQLLFQLKKGKKKNPLSDIIGKWPGNETDEEFNNIINDLD